MSVNGLAINGGKPVRQSPMPLRNAYGREEEKMISKVLAYYRDKGSEPGYEGFFEAKYCREFCKMMGGGYADSVATGTAAIFVAIAALNLPEMSEVLVSPITDPGTLNAIIMNKLKPKLADTMPGSYNVGGESAAIVHAIVQIYPSPSSLRTT